MMQPDDQVCLCYGVTLRKIRAYLARVNPPVASLISECLDAGTGCGWCVPYLERLHAEHAGGTEPGLAIDAERYSVGRDGYKETGHRAGALKDESGSDAADQSS